MKKNIVLSLLYLVPLAFLGCGGGAPDPYVVHKVTGTVTLDGAPLEGASVTFFPDGSNAEKMSASSSTDDKGQYTLTTQGVKKQGAVAGKYKVAITKLQGGGELTDEEKAEALKKSAGSGAMPASGVVKELVPKKYTNPQSSGFEVVVEANDNNVHDFPLTK